VLFHPGFAEAFHHAGHPSVIMSSHAVDLEVFKDEAPDLVFDVAWAGRTDLPIYATRRRLLPRLAARFSMNDWQRTHSYQELAWVFKRSKVVVNIPRDDYPRDANLRCFEAMASGSLLVTRRPTELTSFGFEEGRHFVAYDAERDVPDLVHYYLDRERQRKAITEAARELVLREHTFDNRAGQLLEAAERCRGRLTAPARRWSEDQIGLVYLHYYATHSCLTEASQELRSIAETSRTSALRGAPLLARAWASAERSRVRRRFAARGVTWR
jgi:hypothetical protein